MLHFLGEFSDFLQEEQPRGCPAPLKLDGASWYHKRQRGGAAHDITWEMPGDSTPKRR